MPQEALWSPILRGLCQVSRDFVYTHILVFLVQMGLLCKTLHIEGPLKGFYTDRYADVHFGIFPQLYEIFMKPPIEGALQIPHTVGASQRPKGF